MSVTVRIDTAKFGREMRLVGAELASASEKGVRVAMRKFETDFKQKRLSGGEGLRKRTGDFSRSWNIIIISKKTKRASNVIGELATNGVQGRIQEEGGVVRPKSKPWLWIPSDHLLTPAGVFKGWQQVNWDAVFYRRSKRNPANRVALELRRSGPVRHVATLTKQVTLPPRMGLGDLFIQTKQDHVNEIVRALQAAKGIQ